MQMLLHLKLACWMLGTDEATAASLFLGSQVTQQFLWQVLVEAQMCGVPSMLIDRNIVMMLSHD
jgi:hypothetical protein